MNTSKIKEIGKWMMIIGGSIFTAGTGCYGVANYIERREQKKIHKAELDRIESAHITKENQLKEEAATARIEKDRVYSEQLKNMDQKTFAKFHADNVARANQKKSEKRLLKNTKPLILCSTIKMKLWRRKDLWKTPWRKPEK